MGFFVGTKVDPGHVDDRSYGKIHVEHDNQGVYSLFSANNDAICIVWATITWDEEYGGNKYAVSGDFGRVCGGTWYWSHMYTTSAIDSHGNVKDDVVQPTCFWIDKNGDQPQTGFQVRWPSFSPSNFDPDHKNPQRFCNGVDFGLRKEHDPNGIRYWTGGHKARRDDPKTRGQQPQRASWAKDQLVVSDHAGHSVKELCGSDTSMGPDFAQLCAC